MAEKPVTKDVVLRPRRQVTLPKEVCERLGIQSGDRLRLTLEGSALVMKPNKVVALEALRRIQEAFRRSGITEEEIQEELYRVRHGTNGERRAGQG